MNTDTSEWGLKPMIMRQMIGTEGLVVPKMVAEGRWPTTAPATPPAGVPSV